MDRERIEAYVDAAAAALDLPLAPAHRPGVLAYFALAAGLADAGDGGAARRARRAGAGVHADRRPTTCRPRPTLAPR